MLALQRLAKTMYVDLLKNFKKAPFVLNNLAYLQKRTVFLFVLDIKCGHQRQILDSSEMSQRQRSQLCIHILMRDPRCERERERERERELSLIHI